MGGLIQRNQNNDDSSSDEDDSDDESDSDDDENSIGNNGMGYPQNPWIVQDRYRFDVGSVPDNLWPTLLERASKQHRFVNNIHDKRSGVYYLLRKGPLFLNNPNERQIIRRDRISY